MPTLPSAESLGNLLELLAVSGIAPFGLAAAGAVFCAWMLLLDAR